MIATLLRRFEIRSTFSINLFCYLFIFSAFIWSLVVGSRRESKTSGKVRVSWLSSGYGNRRCEFRFPQKFLTKKGPSGVSDISLCPRSKIFFFFGWGIRVYVYVPTPPPFNEGGQLSSSYDELPTYPLQGSSRLVVQCKALLSGSISWGASHSKFSKFWCPANLRFRTRFVGQLLWFCNVLPSWFRVFLHSALRCFGKNFED